MRGTRCIAYSSQQPVAMQGKLGEMEDGKRKMIFCFLYTIFLLPFTVSRLPLYWLLATIYWLLFTLEFDIRLWKR
ncbi:MAG: hypothetical protein AB1546_01480 [bacterium]